MKPFFVWSIFLLVGCSPPNSHHLATATSGIQKSDHLFLRDFADLFPRQLFKAEDLLSDPQLVSVTREFGPSQIDMTRLPIHSTVAAGDVKPWSSWWYPKKEALLLQRTGEDRLSTFAKYDLIRRSKKSRAGSSEDFENSQHVATAQTWEGLCDAWSLASILSKEPKRPVTIKYGRFKSVTFEISELKGLLLKTFEAIDDSSLKIYGQKFTGDLQGWIYPDIFPDQFHRFIEVELFHNHKSFIMDHDPGVEIWSVPVFRANFVIEAIPEKTNAVFVRTWLTSAEPSPRDEVDFVGIKETIREYDYVLEGDRNDHGQLVVKSGYWVKTPGGVDSRTDHPDYFIRLPNPNEIKRKSWNPEIEVPLIDEIIAPSL